MQKEAQVSQELAKEGGELGESLKQLAARNIGNRSNTWFKAYDLLIKVKEAHLVESIMRALKGELAKEVEKSKLLTKKRVRVGGQDLARPCPPAQRVEEEKEEDGGGVSWWSKAWAWLPWGGRG